MQQIRTFIRRSYGNIGAVVNQELEAEKREKLKKPRIFVNWAEEKGASSVAIDGHQRMENHSLLMSHRLSSPVPKSIQTLNQLPPEMLQDAEGECGYYSTGFPSQFLVSQLVISGERYHRRCHYCVDLFTARSLSAQLSHIYLWHKDKDSLSSLFLAYAPHI